VRSFPKRSLPALDVMHFRNSACCVVRLWTYEAAAGAAEVVAEAVSGSLIFKHGNLLFNSCLKVN
jgi:hypothetical protein